MPHLSQITLQGFKSIKDLKEFDLNQISILVGANGAGKSNLVDFFRMLRAMADGGLQKYIENTGGADSYFFNGPKETEQINAHLKFGLNDFRFKLAAAVSGEMIIIEEATRYRGGNISSDWRLHASGKKESGLPSWKNKESSWGSFLSAEAYVYRSVAGWTVYHVHDTSNTSPMRRDGSARDFRELRPDAGNIAAFLLQMRQTNNSNYQRIRETVQLIAPFFDDFILEPHRKGDNELVRLEWRQRGSSFPFQPWQFSDGTIRFICLATALLQPAPPRIIVIDEPELGLHPLAIELLAALINECTGQKGPQLLISTQSSALLDHFRPEDVIIVDRLDGASVFNRVNSDALQQWLNDYSLGELMQSDIIEAGPRYV